MGHPILYPHGDLKRQDPAKKAPFRLLTIGFFAIARPEIDRYRSPVNGGLVVCAGPPQPVEVARPVIRIVRMRRPTVRKATPRNAAER